MTITVTHANLNTPIDVATNLIFGMYYSVTHKCTMLVASGGAMLPVKESLDEIKAKMSASSVQQSDAMGQILRKTSSLISQEPVRSSTPNEPKETYEGQPDV